MLLNLGSVGNLTVVECLVDKDERYLNFSFLIYRKVNTSLST